MYLCLNRRYYYPSDPHTRRNHSSKLLDVVNNPGKGYIRGRGLHLLTFQLNVSTFHGIGGAFGGVQEVVTRVQIV